MPLARITSFIFVFSGLAQAQGPLTCAAEYELPPTVRSSGKTEQVTDLVLTCTGGTPTPANVRVPVYTLKLQSKSGLGSSDRYTGTLSVSVGPANITSRLLTSDGWSEAPE